MSSPLRMLCNRVPYNCGVLTVGRSDGAEKPQLLAALVHCMKERHASASTYDAMELPEASADEPSRRTQ